jgi:Tol biopolymer transport system component
MKVKAGFLGIGFVIFVTSGFAQQSGFPVLKGPYLGQEPPGMTPEIFAPGIVSVEKYSEFVCMFSPGGDECIFDRHGDDEYQQGAVFVTRLISGKWTEPEIHPLFAGYDDVFLPTLSPDGRYWFFTSKTLPVPEGTKKIIPMYFMKKTETGWTEPAYLTQSIHASMTLDGTVFLNSGRKIIAHPELKSIFDLYGSLSFETGHPVISPDGSYLVFDNRKLAGQRPCKLFVSYKNGESWTDPVSLEPYIKQHAFCSWISCDGKYIFFHSLDGAKGNIYWISAEIVEKLKPKLK